MNATINAIYEILKNDETLVGLLALNKPYWNPEGTAEKVNSIIPADVISTSFEMPFLSIQEGPATKLGERFFDEFVFIRCYNGVDKTSVELNNILERVKLLLDNAELSLTGSRYGFVRMRWTGSLPPLVDEAFNLRFGEHRYRILLL